MSKCTYLLIDVLQQNGLVLHIDANAMNKLFYAYESAYVWPVGLAPNFAYFKIFDLACGANINHEEAPIWTIKYFEELGRIQFEYSNRKMQWYCFFACSTSD